MDPTNVNTALASAFAEELARSGLTRAVISPGSRSTPLALALWNESAIDCTVVLDERVAGFAALGMAAASGEPVALCCTSGTAAANYHPAVAEADLSAIPLVVLTCDRPPELRDNGSGQTIDQIGLYGRMARWFCEAGTHDADDDGLLFMRRTACRVFAAAAGDPRPGPAHVNLSWRDPLGPEPVEGAVTATSKLALVGREHSPLLYIRDAIAAHDADLPAAMAALAGDSIRGLIVAGRQTDPALRAVVSRFSEATGYPVLAEPTSQLRFGPDVPKYLVANYDLIARARPAALDPELVIRIGEMPTSKALRQWLGDLDDCEQVVLDPTHGYNEPTSKAALILRGDPAVLLEATTALIGAGDGLHESDDWARAWAAADESAAKAATDVITSTENLTEPRLHKVLGGLYTDGDLVYTASSMPIRDQEMFVGSGSGDVLFLSNRGANGIDGTISAGLGAAIASGRRTWIVTGEMALQHDMGALALATEKRPDARIVVINNGGGGIFQLLPQADQIPSDTFRHLMTAPSPVDTEALAAAFELDYLLIDSPESLDRFDEIERGPIVVDVSPTVSLIANANLHKMIGDAAIAALSR